MWSYINLDCFNLRIIHHELLSSCNFKAKKISHRHGSNKLIHFFINLQFQFNKGNSDFLCLLCITVNLQNSHENITKNILFTKPTRDYFVSQPMIEYTDKHCKTQKMSTVFLCEDQSLMQGDAAKKVSDLIRYRHVILETIFVSKNRT